MSEPVEDFLVLPGGPEKPPSMPWVTLLAQHWRTIAAASLVGALAGAIVGLSSPAWYESSARLVVIPADDPTSPSSTSVVDGANATVPMLVAIVRSRSVVAEAVERLGLAAAYGKNIDEARLELSNHLEVTSDRKANMVTVAAEDRVPTRARDVAALVAELASQRAAELWAARSHQHRIKLEADLAQVSQRLRDAEDQLRRFREENHVFDLPSQIKASVEAAAALERQRIDKDIGLHYLRGFGGSNSIEVQRAVRERQATARALAVLEHGPIATGPLLPLDRLPPLEREQSQLKRAVDLEAARVEVLSLKISQLLAAEARPGGRPELVDPAGVPRHRSRPARTLMCLQFAVAAALVAALFVWLRAWRRREADACAA